jgi:hypothetical protein
VGSGRWHGKGAEEWYKYCVHMYIYAKMITFETLLGMDGVGNKGKWGRGESKYDIFIHCKNFCKCHNVLPSSKNNKNSKCKKDSNELINNVNSRLG